jgi:hypothetical protein
MIITNDLEKMNELRDKNEINAENLIMKVTLKTFGVGGGVAEKQECCEAVLLCKYETGFFFFFSNEPIVILRFDSVRSYCLLIKRF